MSSLQEWMLPQWDLGEDDLNELTGKVLATKNGGLFESWMRNVVSYSRGGKNTLKEPQYSIHLLLDHVPTNKVVENAWGIRDALKKEMEMASEPLWQARDLRSSEARYAVMSKLVTAMLVEHKKVPPSAEFYDEAVSREWTALLDTYTPAVLNKMSHEDLTFMANAYLDEHPKLTKYRALVESIRDLRAPKEAVKRSSVPPPDAKRMRAD